MDTRLKFITSGTVTSPRGFHAGATYAGIKKKADGVLDLAILFSEVPGTAAALFTTNRVKAAFIGLNQQRLKRGIVSALVVNSGCANAFTGSSPGIQHRCDRSTSADKLNPGRDKEYRAIT